MYVTMLDLDVPWDFIFDKWLLWSDPGETISEFLEKIIVLREGFEFLLRKGGR